MQKQGVLFMDKWLMNHKTEIINQNLVDCLNFLIKQVVEHTSIRKEIVNKIIDEKILEIFEEAIKINNTGSPDLLIKFADLDLLETEFYKIVGEEFTVVLLNKLYLDMIILLNSFLSENNKVYLDIGIIEKVESDYINFRNTTKVGR